MHTIVSCAWSWSVSVRDAVSFSACSFILSCTNSPVSDAAMSLVHYSASWLYCVRCCKWHCLVFGMLVLQSCGLFSTTVEYWVF